MKKTITVLKWIGIFLVAWTAFGYVLMATGVVKEDKPVVLNEHPRTVMICPTAGLGDTFDNIDAVWGKTYSKKAESGERVSVGPSENAHFEYDKGFMGYVFGTPLRCGSLDGNVAGLFGASTTERSISKELFFTGIKDILPKDFTFVKAYYRKSKKDTYGTYIMCCHSELLSQIPGIDKSIGYDTSFRHAFKLGDFHLYATESNMDTTKIVCWDLFLGVPGETDLSGAKEINYNPWVVDSDK